MHIVLMYSTHVPSAEHVARLEALHPGTRVTVAGDEENARRAAETANVIFGHRYLRQCLPYAARLQWVQATSGGIDRLPTDALARAGVRLTYMTLFSSVIARHAVALAWAVTRRLPEAWSRQRAGLWDPSLDWLPFPRTAVVFGTGSIGQELALLLGRDGMTVHGVKRTLKPGATVAGFDRLYAASDWREAVSGVDWCFLALPHTPETRGMFDERLLRTLPRHAVLVNVGRGETVVTPDLVRVLNDGHLGGAALDVVYPKPTGPEDPVWATPRLILTPHVAAHHVERSARMEAFCERQFGRFLAGDALVDEVDLKAYE